MTQEQLITIINQLQVTLIHAKEALEKTYIPAYAILHYIKEETGLDISQTNIKVG